MTRAYGIFNDFPAPTPSNATLWVMFVARVGERAWCMAPVDPPSDSAERAPLMHRLRSSTPGRPYEKPSHAQVQNEIPRQELVGV